MKFNKQCIAILRNFGPSSTLSFPCYLDGLIRVLPFPLLLLPPLFFLSSPQPSYSYWDYTKKEEEEEEGGEESHPLRAQSFFPFFISGVREMDVLVRRNSSFSGIDSIRTYSTALYLLTVLKVAKRTENFFFMLFKYIYAGKPYFLNFRCTSTTWPPPSCMTSRSRPGRDRRSGRR